jgi:hypothetical protein
MTRKGPTLKILAATELLEDRIAPATLPLLDLSGGTTVGTFTDADGDTVIVRIEGTAGKVEFKDAGGNAVDNGDDIASVTITGSSPDFELTYSFAASGGGANLVAMGDITANKILRGVFSVPFDATNGLMRLGSFVGPGFSAGGGLSADDVIGNADGIGIQVKSLGAGRSINIRNNFAGDLIILGALGGTIDVRSSVSADSLWQINKAVTPTAQIAVGGDFSGDFEARGPFAGDVNIAGAATGTWTFNNHVLKSAELSADRWKNIKASKSWGGQLFAVTSNITIAVGGQILGSSVFSGEGKLELNVTGSVQSGAAFGFTGDITATVGGNLSGHWAGSQDVTLTVSGSVAGAVIASGNNLSLTVEKTILNSQIESNDNLILDVNGSVNSSHLAATSSLSAAISGSVVNSALEGSSQDLTVTVGGNLIASRVTCGSEDLTLNVEGNVVRSTVISLESDVQLTVEGSLTDSHVAAAADLIATIARSVTRSSLIANQPVGTDPDTDLSLTVGGDITASHLTAVGDISLGVAGRSTGSSFVSTNGDVRVAVERDMASTRIEAASGVTLGVGGQIIGSAIAGDEGASVLVEASQDLVGTTVSVLDEILTLHVGRNMIASNVNASQIALILVGGSMSNSQVNSGGDVALTVTGNISRSTIASPQSSVNVNVGGNFLASSVTCDEDMFFSVEGNMSGIVNSFDSSISLEVGGTMSGKAIADETLFADLGQLTGSLSSDQLDLIVQGNVAASARIQARAVDDFNADTIGFSVGGDFGGVLNVIDFDSDVVGGSTLIDGDVLKSARFNIARSFGDATDEDFIFGGNFLGVLNIGGSIDVDLAFAGDVNQVIIGGLIGTAGVVNAITVSGKLNFLSSASVFVETTPGKEGNFQNIQSIVTATLSVQDGFGTVIPSA